MATKKTETVEAIGALDMNLYRDDLNAVVAKVNELVAEVNVLRGVDMSVDNSGDEETV